MKKITFVFVTLFVLASSAVFSQSENGLIGRARGAAHECLQPFHGSLWIVNASVNVVSTCFVSGSITQVLFSARPEVAPCNDEPPCNPPPLPIVIAVVYFGCDGELLSVSCY